MLARFVFLWCLVLFPVGVSAQTSDPSLRIRILSAGMQPGDTITLEVFGSESLSTNLVRWFVDDVITEEGVGRTTSTVLVGPPGTIHTVYAELITIGGVEQSPDITIAGALVDVIWEGSGYTHPFYRGRSLSGPDGNISVEAHTLFIDAAGSVIPENRIIFTWKLNDRTLKSSSGLGKSTLLLPAPPLFGEDILSVEAEDPVTYTKAEKKVRIPGTPPHTSLYPIDPLLGIQFSSVVNANRELGAKASLVPYFTNISHLKDTGMIVSWFLFDNPLPSTGLTVTLPTTGILRAVYQNKQSLLDNVSTRWSFLTSGDVEVEYESRQTNVFSGETE